MSDWQATQLFLSDTGVHLVDINVVSTRLRCDCPGYSSRNQCKHVKFVRNRMSNNQGVYPVEVSNKASTEEAAEAKETPESFRKFLLKYGKVEVI